MRSFSFAFSVVLASSTLVACGDGTDDPAATDSAPACKAGSGPVEVTIDRTKQLGALTADERAALCDERPAAAVELPCTCPDGRPSELRAQQTTREECIASAPPAGCTATVEDMLACAAALQANPCDLARAQEDAHCKALSSCVEG